MRRIYAVVAAVGMIFMLTGTAPAMADKPNPPGHSASHGQSNATHGNNGHNNSGHGNVNAKGNDPTNDGQGKSDSDPDGNTNGGPDKPGGSGGVNADKDGNNGSGNDSDCEDDNNGKGVPGHCKSNSGNPSEPSHPTSTPTPVDHGNAGKVTICHATGSNSNPYVEITISKNALPAHEHHQNGEDIIPAPAGGCPTGIIPVIPTPTVPTATPTTPGTPVSTPTAPSLPTEIPVVPGTPVPSNTLGSAPSNTPTTIEGVPAHGPSVAPLKATPTNGVLPNTGAGKWTAVILIAALILIIIGIFTMVRNRRL